MNVDTLRAEDAERHYCRNPKCRSKLPAPAGNPREAFCARGCHASFYRHRCLVCEAAIDRRTEHQKFCRRPLCKSRFRASPVSFEWSGYPVHAQDSKNA
jgi:hypothetical protein